MTTATASPSPARLVSASSPPEDLAAVDEAVLEVLRRHGVRLHVGVVSGEAVDALDLAGLCVASAADWNASLRRLAEAGEVSYDGTWAEALPA